MLSGPHVPRTPERKSGPIPVLESPEVQQLQRTISVSESEVSDVPLQGSEGNMVDNEHAQPHLGCMILRFWNLLVTFEVYFFGRQGGVGMKSQVLFK